MRLVKNTWFLGEGFPLSGLDDTPGRATFAMPRYARVVSCQGNIQRGFWLGGSLAFPVFWVSGFLELAGLFELL